VSERHGTEGLIDIHAHFAPEWYIEAARAAGNVTPDGTPGWPSWTVDDHLRLMDDAGIERAVLSVSSPGAHFGDDAAAAVLARKINEFAAELCWERPDRFSFFAALPLPAIDAALAEADRATDELGAIGIAVQSNHQGIYLNDMMFDSLWKRLDARCATVFVHPTTPAGWERTALGLPRSMVEFLFDTTRSIMALALDGTLDRFPMMKLVIPHCGAALPALMDRIEMFQTAMLTAADYPAGSRQSISETLRRLWYDIAGTPMPHSAPLLASTLGTEHMLYGSDYCFAPPPVVAQQIASMDSFWNHELYGSWRQLTRANAEGLLGIS